MAEPAIGTTRVEQLESFRLAKQTQDNTREAFDSGDEVSGPVGRIVFAELIGSRLDNLSAGQSMAGEPDGTMGLMCERAERGREFGSWLALYKATLLVLLAAYGLLAQASATTEESAAKLIKLHPPAFPFELDAEMGASGANGEVEIRLRIRRDGSVESAEVVASRARRGDAPYETPGLKQWNELALESARRSEFDCHACQLPVAPYNLLYSFEPGPVLKGWCGSFRTGVAPPPELREEPKITRTGNRVKVVGPLMPQCAMTLIMDRTFTPDEKRLNGSFEELANDAAGPEKWLESATDITLRRDIHRSLTDSTIQEGLCTRGPNTPEPLGESLRARKNPSVSELLAKRATAAVASKNPWVGCGLAFLAYTWDRQASLPLLQAVGAVEECRRDLLLASARIERGDSRAAADWAASMKSEISKLRTWWNARGEATSALSPLWLFPNDPALEKFASWLFEGRHAPLSPRDDFERIGSPLLTVPAYRRAVIAALGDSTVVGTATRHANGSSLVETRYVAWFDPGGADRQAQPSERPVRVKDIVTLVLSGVEKSPKFKLDWEEPARDRAIAHMAEFFPAKWPALRAFPGKVSDLVCLEEEVEPR
jgi:hypothetical protein